ncbi:chymotrypsinogen A [Lepeophtheirus salmonis]|nr:chymotrypsinogen A-like [Lepeophtheirus salmonis]
MKSLLVILLGTCLALCSSDNIDVKSGNIPLKIQGRSTEQCGCGYTRYGTSACDGSSSRIIGGRNAKDQEYPWQALIKICRDGKCGMCGGTLINFRYVLTAAHCLQDKGVVTPINGLTVTLGTQSQTNSNAYTRSYSVDSIIIHGEYTESTVRNDIALLKLSSLVEVNDGTYPACIPTDENKKYVDQLVVVSGWGRYSLSSENLSPLLKRTGLKVLSNSHQYCINGAGLNQTPVDSKMCAYESGTDSCAGDSGGPLILPEDGRCTIVGIVSYGVGCANAFHAGVYTRVTSFLFWIKYLSKDGGCMENKSPRKCDLSSTNLQSLTGNYRLNDIQSSCTKGICYAFDKNINLCKSFNAPGNQGLNCPYSNQCDLREVLINVYENPSLPKIHNLNIAGIPLQCNTKTGDCCDTRNPNNKLCDELNKVVGSNMFSRKGKA